MVQGSVTQSKPTNDETAIRSVMVSYNEALTTPPQARRWRFTPRTEFLCRPIAKPDKAARRKICDAIMASRRTARARQEAPSIVFALGV